MTKKMVTTFTWQTGTRFTGNANVVGHELARLMKLGGGQLEPTDVVRAAQSKKSALHNYFEWDNGKAAVAWRITQARELLRAVVSEVPDPNIYQVRAFVAPGNRGPYITRQTAYAETPARKALITQAVSELRSWTRRWAELTELGGTIQNVETALRHWDR